MVYVMLASRANRHTGWCFAARKEIAKEIGCTERAVSKGYIQLIGAELLIRTRTGSGKRANEFVVCGLMPPQEQGGQRL
ncbi:MAG: helix-turn-helix domain-containing protein [Planctomycetes bacterium]|nr:helix-turn-helix domain-containing protein [Planctomycetota bacterium]